MARLSKTLFVAAALAAAPVSTAFADDAATEPAPDAAPADPNAAPADTSTEGAMPTPAADDVAPATPPMPGLTLAKGKIVIGGETVTIGLFPDNAGKPFSLAPSVWYGVSDKLTLGLTHDGGTTGWTPRPALGAGICLSGTDGGCAKAYNNISVDALFALATDKFSVAAHPALDFVSISDPSMLALRLGVLGRYMASEKVAITFDPRIRIGLTERDFNKELLDIPVWFWFHANDKMAIGVNTGIAGPLDGFGDAFIVPVGANFTYMLSDKMEAGLDFSFLNLAGKNSSADFKALGLRFAYHL